MNRRLHAAHRWIAAVALAQLLVWTTTGLLFSILPQERVSGASVPKAHDAPIPADAGAQSPDAIARRAAEAGVQRITKIELRATPAGLFYIVRGDGGPLRLDARTGAPAPVSLAEAEETARRDQPGRPPVLESRLIERDPHPEYRTKPLPAFRIALGDASGMVIYVDAKTGDVSARRSDAFRAFDLFFRVHTMDYGATGSLNNPLLTAAAVLGLLTVWSGVVLWGVRVARRIRGRADPEGAR